MNHKGEYKMNRFRGRVVVDFNFLMRNEEEVYERIHDDLLDSDYNIQYIDITDEEEEWCYDDNYGN